jgi:hypothetical protein
MPGASARRGKGSGQLTGSFVASGLEAYKSYRELRLALQQTFHSRTLSTLTEHPHKKVSGLSVLKFRFVRWGPYLIQQRSVGDRKKLSPTFDSLFLVGERVLEHFINIDQLADSCARFDLLLKEALRLQ